MAEFSTWLWRCSAAPSGWPYPTLSTPTYPWWPAFTHPTHPPWNQDSSRLFTLGVGCRHAHLAPFTCWQAIWCTRTAKFWTLTVAQKTTSWFLSCSMMLAQGRVARKSHLWGLRQGRGLVVSDTGSSSPFLPTLQLCNYLVLNPRRNWGSSWVFKSYWVYQNQFRCLCRSVTGTHTKTICILTSLCVEPSSTPSSPHRTCLTKQVSQDIKQWRNYKHHLVPSF